MPLLWAPYLLTGAFVVEHIRSERDTGARIVALEGVVIGGTVGAGLRINERVFTEAAGSFGCRASTTWPRCGEPGARVSLGARWDDGRAGWGFAGTLGYADARWDNVGVYLLTTFAGSYRSGDGLLGASVLGTWEATPSLRLRADLGAALGVSLASEEPTRLAGPRIDLFLQVTAEFDLGRPTGRR